MTTLTIEGIIERIKFFNEKNFFSVLVLYLDNDEKVVVTGNFADIRVGMRIRVCGNYVNHPRYGKQIKAISYLPVLPETKRGVKDFLSSGLIKGVGKVFADRIVSYFGDDTIRILDEDPERLLEIPKIGKKKLKSIIESWEKEKHRRDVLIELQSLGLTHTNALKIYTKYKEDAPSKVKENPYNFIKEIRGIGFKTADRIALDVGFRFDDERRIRAGIKYCLDEATNDGHTFLMEGELIARAAEEISIESKNIIDTVKIMQEHGEIVREVDGEEERIYEPHLYWIENEVAKIICAMLNYTKGGKVIHVNKKLFKEDGEITLTDEQIEAINLGITEGAVIITGGPGTGKTTLIKGIINEAKTRRWNIALCAPTGRAAKRLSIATDMEAMTIHRLLEYNGETGKFKRNSYYQLDCDIVIVDEMSMVDILLFYSLLCALPPHCSAVFVGDADQLPSIGPGNVLRDLINSKIIPTIKLTKIFRQSEGSLIITNAHRILKGDPPLLKVPSVDEKISDFYFIEKDDPAQIYEKIIELVTQRIPSRFSFDPVDDIQVISPMYRGEIGVDYLNEGMARILNPHRGEEKRFYSGDKVMQIHNNYNKEVFNGDIGRVVFVGKETNEVIVNFDGRNVLYNEDELDELVLAYAISVHKSQGSEYPAVIIPIHTQHYMMLRRNLLYTGVTRGKKLVVLIGSKKALLLAIKNEKEIHRNTTLCRRIVSLANF